MVDNSPAIQRKQRNRLLKSLIINLAAIGLAVYLLIPAGLIYSVGMIDLSFLVLPLVGYFVLR
jgi:hypothetical protein